MVAQEMLTISLALALYKSVAGAMLSLVGGEQV